MSMRSGASVCQDLAFSSVPRGARTSRGSDMTSFRSCFSTPFQTPKAGCPGLSLVGLGQRHTSEATVTQHHLLGLFWPACLRYKTVTRPVLGAALPAIQSPTQKCRPGSAFTQVGVVQRQGSALRRPAGLHFQVCTFTSAGRVPGVCPPSPGNSQAANSTVLG